MRSTDSPPRSPIGETLPRFATVMAVLIAIAAFPQSALFTVDRIEVSGEFTLPPATVITIAGVHYGERLFAVDVMAALSQLRADPRIKTAEVQIRPPRAVLLRITERQPVVALMIGKQFALLDDDLMVVSVGPYTAGLPEVVDRIRGTPWARAGAPIVSEAARVALLALPAIPRQLGADVRRLVVAPGPDLTLVLRSGLEVRAGGLRGLGERLAQVPPVLAALRARGIAISAVDLRYSGSIAVTPVTGGEGR
jgi:cell division septal protein FtsQ